MDEHNIQEQFEVTKWVIRSRKSKDKKCNGLKFEYTKGMIISGESKDRHHNGQMFENYKVVIRSVNRRRTDNTMAECFKIPKE